MDNLFLAGRDMSLSHAAFGSVRVMETLAQVGQGVGTAAAIALEERIPPAELPTRCAGRIKQRMLRDGCFLLNTPNEDPDDHARRGTATASSTAPVHGVSPNPPAFHDGLSIWWDQYNPIITERLDATRGQLIAVGHERLDEVQVLLSNDSGAPRTIRTTMRVVDHIWDYRLESGNTLFDGQITVEPGGPAWYPIRANLDLSGRAIGSFLRLNLYADDGVLWHVAQPILPAHVTMFEITSGRMRTYQQGVTMSFRVSPPQYPFPAENVLSRWTRPYRATNLWRSDPLQPLHQWLALSWNESVTIGQVELTFPGHLLREYHAYGPYHRDPQTPGRYSIEIQTPDGGWERVFEVRDNFQRHRKHLLAQDYTTSALRVVVHDTNGDPSAAIYEVRCY